MVHVNELSPFRQNLGFVRGTDEGLAPYHVHVALANSVTELNPTTLEGKALIGGLALAADIEHSLIQERNERGWRVIKERGIRVGHKPINLSSEAVKALAEKGMSQEMIAQELGASKATINRQFKTIGIKRTTVTEMPRE